MSASEQRDAFRRALYPILLSGNTAAFRRFLTQWEEVIGDTAELAETSEAQQRKTMEALLRRPQQFNLPPWPRDVPAHPPDRQLELDDDPEVAQVGPVRASTDPVEALAEPPPHPIDPVPGPTTVLGQDSTAVELSVEPALDGSGVYQLDMITGELVPVDAAMVRLAHPAQPLEEPEPAAPKRRRPRRKRAAANLAQLVFWSEDELAS